MDIFYTVEEIAKILKITKENVRAIIRQNKLKAIKIGRELRVKESDLKEFVK
ncbi:MAG: Helix-turn-helix domain [Bacteroidota bacterium]